MLRAVQPVSERRGTHSTVSAFTLIELLVVVAIIALLISILLPSLSAAREQARAVKCMSNLRSIGTGIALYTEHHLGTLPGPLHPPVFRRTGSLDFSPGEEDDWYEMDPETERPWFLLARLAEMTVGSDEEFYEYVDEVATCPTAKMKNPDRNFKPDVSGNPSWSRPYNYLINSWSNTKPDFYFGWTNIGVTWAGWTACHFEDPQSSSCQPPKRIEWIKWPADEWAVGDAWWDFRRVMIVPGEFEDSMLGTWQLLDPTPTDPSGQSHNPLPRKPYHKSGKGTNLLFFDGHAGSFVGVDEWAREFPHNRADADEE